MSGSFARNKSVAQQRSQQTSQQTSDPLTANAVAEYFDKLNSFSGGGLDKFARGANSFQGASPEQIKSLGGLGATRINKVTTERDRVNADYGSDASLSVLQKIRAKQLNNDSASATLDAVARETEAAITGLTNSNAINKTKMNREDLMALAEIYFGGKGQSSVSVSNGDSSGGSRASGFRIAGGIGGGST